MVSKTNCPIMVNFPLPINQLWGENSECSLDRAKQNPGINSLVNKLSRFQLKAKFWIIVLSNLCLLSACAGMESKLGWKAERELNQLHTTSCFAEEKRPAADRLMSPATSLVYLASDTETMPVMDEEDAASSDRTPSKTHAQTLSEKPEQPYEALNEFPTEKPEQPTFSRGFILMADDVSTEQPEQPTEQPEQPTEEKPEQPIEKPEQPKSGKSVNDGNWLWWLIPIGVVITGGIVALIQAPDLADFLAEEGPQVPPAFTMNSFTVIGLVQGNWPVVLDYQAEQPTSLLVEVCTAEESFQYRLNVTEKGRQWHLFRLPARFGDRPKPGAIKILATEEVRDEKGLASFQIYGLGVGPKAIGSIAIDQLDFQLDENQKVAFYSYIAHQSFNTVSPEILRLQRNATATGIQVERIWWRDKEHLLRGISASPDPQPRDNWDCKEGRPWPEQAGQVSVGPHLLQVRAWFGPQDTDKSWVVVWSNHVIVPKE